MNKNKGEREREKEGKTTSVYVCEQRVFPFFAPMRSFIKDLSNLHTDFFSSSSSGLSFSLYRSLSLSLLSLSDQKTAIVEKREGKI